MSGIISVSPDMRSGVIGKYPVGHVLQVQHHLNITASSITSTSANILTKTFNRIKGNSHFVCTAAVSMSMYATGSNQDTADPRLWWSVDGSQRTTNSALSDNGFYYADYPSWWHENTEYDGRGDVYYYHGSEDFTHISSGSDNDSVTIAVAAGAGSKGIYINRSQGFTSSGGISTLCILEVQ